MLEEKTEGIVLRSLDYKDNQKIITVFSQDAGIISLIVKGLSRKNYRLLSLTSPFSRAEFIYRKGTSTLFRLIDGTMLNPHISLRETLASVQAAGSLAHAILHSQLPGKSTPALYQLLSSYLKQIPSFAHLPSLIASFQLKLLKHEGLIALSPLCSRCGKLPARSLHQGESLCDDHHTSGTHRFTAAEWDLLQLLAHAQQFNSLRQLKLPDSLSERIATCFYERLRQD